MKRGRSDEQSSLMSGDVSVDIGSALGYIEDRVRGFFGKDPETQEWNQRLKDRLRYAVEQARWVQCIGMSEPIPIAAIYQPLLLDSETTGTSDALELIRKGKSAVVFAGPGRGKSTLLSWLYIRLLSNESIVPFLFVLRSENAVADLAEFTARLAAGKTKSITGKKKPLLLIDGYDEIEVEERKSVSKSLSTL